MAKNFFDELTGFRVKVERDGKEIVNVPGILALPAALVAPQASILGTVAASLLGCSIHLEDADGKGIDMGKVVRDAADSVKTAAKTVKDEVEKTLDELSADDPEGCPVGEENEPEDVASGEESAEDAAEDVAEDIAEELEAADTDDIPTIRAENPDKPE